MLLADSVVADDIQLLERCVNDLIRLVALPALWGTTRPQVIADNLCSVLTGMLRLDFVHVDLEARDVDPGLFRKLRIASFPIPSGGLLIAGSSRSDFPTRIERLLLRVAANQVTLWQAGATRTERYLAEGQRLSHTGSWAENKITGEVFWSDEMFRIFAYEPGTSITFQKIIEERVHPDDRAAFVQKAETTMREKHDIDFEHRIVFPDGSIRFHHVVAHPIVNAAGEVVEIFGTTMDITDRTMAMESARLAQMELAHVTRLTTMGELVASIAHEVNQPLAAVVTNGNASLRWLDAEPPNLREVRDANQRIIGDAMRASQVVARVRSLVAKKEPERVALDINDVVRAVLALTAAEMRRYGVSLQTDLAADVRAVFADPIQLQQVMLNLSINAIDAMRAETCRERTLVVRSEQAQDCVLVTVKDSGCGISPEDQPRIFDPFYTTKSGGIGMGLAISRSIIQAHGGAIWMTPEPSGGCTFFFTVPLT
ncbi:MAG TPA: ATP-binding protein [Thermoanaerobaculia bacterium]